MKHSHCRRGHPLEGHNIRPGKHGRQCRTCHRERSYQKARSTVYLPEWARGICGKGKGNYTVGEIAAHLGISQQAVCQAIASGLRKVEAAFRGMGYSADDVQDEPELVRGFGGRARRSS